MARSPPSLRTVLVLAVTLVLVGCSGLAASDGSPTRSVTAAPVPGDATPATRATVPGLGPGGVTNATLLATAHRRTLSGTSFTERTVTTARDANGTVLGRESLLVMRGPEAFRLVYAVEGGPRRDARSFQTVAAEVWSDGRTTVQSVTDGDGTTRRERLSNAFYGTFVTPDATLYAGTLERTPLRRVDRRVVDGTTRYVFEAEGLDPEPVFGLIGTTPTGNGSLRAVVGTDGVVRRVVLTFPARYRGRPVTVEHVFEYVDVGRTTAPRPSWYGTAVENGTPTPGMRSEG
jgi:hypothetical protein